MSETPEPTIDILHVRVGTDERPASDADVVKAQERIRTTLSEEGIDAAVLATPHTTSLKVVPGVHMRQGQMFKEAE